MKQNNIAPFSASLLAPEQKIPSGRGLGEMLEWSKDWGMPERLREIVEWRED